MTTRLTADVCVVGGGPAGLSIALELADRGIDVIIVESGAYGGSRHAEKLSIGESAGQLRAPLHEMRKRGVGGTSRVWTSNVARLEREVFEARQWIPNSEWPLRRTDVEPFVDDALKRLGITVDGAELDAHEASLHRHRLFRDGRLVPHAFVSAAIGDVGQRWRTELAASLHLSVQTETHALVIETDQRGQRVTGLRCVRAGRPCFISASHFVLATGAIEVPRLLLSSKNRHHPTGIGDHSGNLGHWYQDHPFAWCGVVTERDPGAFDDLFVPQGEARSAATIASFVTEAPDTAQSERLVRSALLIIRDHSWMASSGFGSPAVEAFRRVRRSIQAGHAPLRLRGQAVDMVRGAGDLARLYCRRRRSTQRSHVIRLQAQQAPVYDSTVSLTETVDRHGSPRAKVDWRFGDIELRSVNHLLETFAATIEDTGLGSFQEVARRSDGWPFNLEQGYHSSGTTRMSERPEDGVVDSDCRVHGIENLWVASNAVFPSAGFANPTLTIVALALRIASHIDGQG